MKLLLIMILSIFLNLSYLNAGLLDLFNNTKLNKSTYETISIEYLEGIENEGSYFLSVHSIYEDLTFSKEDFKLIDDNGNEVDFSSYVRYIDTDKMFIIKFDANFFPDTQYTLKLRKEYKSVDKKLFKFNVNKLIQFNSKELNMNDFSVSNSIEDQNSGKIEFNFYDKKIKTKNIRDFIKFENKNVEYSYNITNNKLLVYGNFKPNKSYKVTLKKDFIVGLMKSKIDISSEVKFGDLLPSLSFKNQNSYISSYTDSLELQSTNIDYVDVKIYRVNDENINYLNIFRNNLLEDSYYKDSYYYDDYSEIVSEYKHNIQKEKNRKQSVLIDFKKQLEKNSDGIYLVSISNKESNKKDIKLVYKSDLGISTKVAKNQMFFSIRSLSNNKPVENAQIFVYNKKNKEIFNSKTNSDGILDKKYQNIIKEVPKLVIVKKNDQINFLNFNNPISDYDILNDYSDELKSDYKALVFMERTLLRPSDKVNMIITVKDKSFKSLVQQMKVKSQLINSMYQDGVMIQLN